jgi:hypothetical protein
MKEAGLDELLNGISSFLHYPKLFLISTCNRCVCVITKIVLFQAHRHRNVTVSLSLAQRSNHDKSRQEFARTCKEKGTSHHTSHRIENHLDIRTMQLEMALQGTDLEECYFRSAKQGQHSGYASINQDVENQLVRTLSPGRTCTTARAPDHFTSPSIPQLLSWKDVQTRGKVEIEFHGDGSSQGKTLNPIQEINLSSTSGKLRC